MQEGSTFVKFLVAGKSIVPNTSNAIAPNKNK